MRTKKIASIYSVLVGFAIIGIWLMLLLTDQVPELTVEPYRILAHIIAEFATGLLLVLSGIALYTNRVWSPNLFIFAQGALFYTLIASPGYYLDRGAVSMVIMFIGILVVNIVLLGLALVQPHKFSDE
ncbi:MAG: hypothetical protein ACFFFC_20610 [Candidatus Thorarchaeota archaeon]